MAFTIDSTDIDSIKSEAMTAFQSTIWDCFKNASNINVYKMPGETVVVEDPLFDSNWGRGTAKVSTKTYLNPAIVFEAIVVYDSPEDLNQFVQDEDELTHVRAQSRPQVIKIRTKLKANLESISKAKQITFVDEQYKIITDIRASMFFGSPLWYELRIQKIN